MQKIDNALIELIKKCSCELPVDVSSAIKYAYEKENQNTPAKFALGDILENVRLGKQNKTPLCQDTGTNYFVVHYPKKTDIRLLEKKIIESVQTACDLNYLRPNSVNPLTNKNTGDNTGKAHPSIDFDEWDNNYIEIKLMLKGGGCENMGKQYSLPDETLNAGRDINGIKKCVLDSVLKAQGFGCSPGILAVCVGGDRADSMKNAKKQLFRKIGSVNTDSNLAEIEHWIFEKANSLEIGAMGYGGKTTLLGVFVDYLNRIPASFFVSVSYMCWACRRKTLKYYADGRFKIE